MYIKKCLLFLFRFRYPCLSSKISVQDIIIRLGLLLMWHPLWYRAFNQKTNNY